MSRIDYVLVTLVLLATGIFCVIAHGCSPAYHDAGAKLLDVSRLVLNAENELEQAAKGLEAEQTAACALAENEMDRTLCRVAVEHLWTRLRMAVDKIRREQTEKLAKLDPAEFLQWFRDSYCDARAVAPPELILPPVPGITCEVAQ